MLYEELGISEDDYNYLNRIFYFIELFQQYKWAHHVSPAIKYEDLLNKILIHIRLQESGNNPRLEKFLIAELAKHPDQFDDIRTKFDKFKKAAPMSSTAKITTKIVYLVYTEQQQKPLQEKPQEKPKPKKAFTLIGLLNQLFGCFKANYKVSSMGNKGVSRAMPPNSARSI